MGALGRSGALALAAAAAPAAWLALRDLEVPGLYYDEVIQALPAAEFLREGGRPLQIPGARSTWLAGGWFPLMTQPYMGALKSQLLIPVFAAFGASTTSLRTTTFAWGSSAASSRLSSRHACSERRWRSRPAPCWCSTRPSSS